MIAWRQCARLVLIAALATAIGMGVGSVILAENALHVPDHSRAPRQAAEPLARAVHATLEDVGVRAADGARLSGWLFTPDRPNGAAAIALHGIADTRLGMLSHARILLDAGYVVLVPDSRGHGASEGPLVTYGSLESRDITRWADLLLSRPGVERLYGVGQSMGAAILLQSLSYERRFAAIAADCPFADFSEIANERLQQNGLGWVARPMAGLGFAYARARYGVDLWHASPVRSVSTTRTPILLIHGTADDNIPIRHSRELHAADPAAELWEVPGAGHVASIGRDPVEYARRLTAFFAAHRESSKK